MVKVQLQVGKVVEVTREEAEKKVTSGEWMRIVTRKGGEMFYGPNWDKEEVK